MYTHEYRMISAVTVRVNEQDIAKMAEEAIESDYGEMTEMDVLDWVAATYGDDVAEGLADSPAADSVIWSITDDVNAQIAEWRRLAEEDAADRAELTAWLQSQQA